MSEWIRCETIEDYERLDVNDATFAWVEHHLTFWPRYYRKTRIDEGAFPAHVRYVGGSVDIETLDFTEKYQWFPVDMYETVM